MGFVLFLFISVYFPLIPECLFRCQCIYSNDREATEKLLIKWSANEELVFIITGSCLPFSAKLYTVRDAMRACHE